MSCHVMSYIRSIISGHMVYIFFHFVFTVAKVIVLVCNTFNLPPKFITTWDTVYQREKGFVAELNNGQLSVALDILVEYLTLPIMPAPRQNARFAPVTSPDSRNFPEWVRSHGNRDQNRQQQQQQLASIAPGKLPPLLKLRGIVRKGKLSDLQIWDPEFKTPDYINKWLLERYHSTPVIGVRIYKHSDGHITWSVDPKLKEFKLDEEIQLTDKESLMLKTGVYYGQISSDELDVKFKYGNWQVPQYITVHVKRMYAKDPDGDLYIISDETGNLRWKIKRRPICKGSSNRFNYTDKGKYKGGN